MTQYQQTLYKEHLLPVMKYVIKHKKMIDNKTALKRYYKHLRYWCYTFGQKSMEE